MNLRKVLNKCFALVLAMAMMLGGIGFGSLEVQAATVSGTTMTKTIAGTSSFLAIDTDGSVWAWGTNEYGELGIGSKTGSSSVRIAPTKVQGLKGIVSLAKNGGNVFAIDSSGNVWGWGANSGGYLGDGTKESQLVPVKNPYLEGVVDIELSYYTSYGVNTALKKDGTVWIWRSSLSSARNGFTPKMVEDERIRNIVSISATNDGAILLRSDGSLFLQRSILYNTGDDGLSFDEIDTPKIKSFIEWCGSVYYYDVNGACYGSKDISGSIASGSVAKFAKKLPDGYDPMLDSYYGSLNSAFSDEKLLQTNYSSLSMTANGEVYFVIKNYDFLKLESNYVQYERVFYGGDTNRVYKLNLNIMRSQPVQMGALSSAPVTPTTPTESTPLGSDLGNIDVNNHSWKKIDGGYLYGISDSPHEVDDIKFEVDNPDGRIFGYRIGGGSFTRIESGHVITGSNCRNIEIVEIDQNKTVKAYNKYNFVPGVNYEHPDPDQWNHVQEFKEKPADTTFVPPSTMELNNMLLDGNGSKFITQGFLMIYPPGYGNYSGKIHTGIDYGIEVGNEIKAPISGEITNSGGYGNTLAIYNSEYDITVIILHSSKLMDNPGFVKKGDVIAITGDKDSPGNPHVHIEIQQGRQTTAPFPPIPAKINEIKKTHYDPRILTYMYPSGSMPKQDTLEDKINRFAQSLHFKCPVNVSISYNGETLSSAAATFNDTAEFGRMEVIGDEKHFYLNGIYNVNIEIDGYDIGKMDYNLCFYDNSGKITEERTFSAVPITAETKIISDTNRSNPTTLKVDGDGDGVYESTLTATVKTENSTAIQTVQTDPNVYATEGKTNGIKLTATVTNSGVLFDWTPSTNNLGYRIYRSKTQGGDGISISDFPLTGSVFFDANVNQHTQYHYSIAKVEAEAEFDMATVTLTPEKVGARGEELPILTTVKLPPEAEASQDYYIPETTVIIEEDEVEIVKTRGFILMTVGDPMMIVNEETVEIDPGRGTVPIITNGRTMIPIRAIAESMGGTADWDAADRRISLDCNKNKVLMWLGKTDVSVNNVMDEMDIAPYVSNDRTLLPVRFSAENIGAQIEWIGTSQRVIIVYDLP